MKGISVSAPKGPLVLEDRPAPELRPGYMIVKPDAVALNPADVFNLDWGFCVPGALMGCDYAGIIEDVSSEDVTRGWKKGDRVCGCTRAADVDQHENGTFADLICVRADLQLNIPESMNAVDAAAFGVTVITTGRAFYDKFGLDYPAISNKGVVNTNEHPRRQILVYGGSAAMGTMYIQFAKLSNFHVITTCSPHNFDLVKSFGADYVVDYKSPTAISDLLDHIKANENTMGKLEMCVDAISTEASAKFCSSILNPSASEDNDTHLLYSAILPFIPPMPGITTFITIGYSFLGEEWEQMGKTNPASREDFEAAKRFAIVATQLIAAGKIRPHPSDVREGGLGEVVKTGFDEMRRGVSGKKLVFRL